MAVVDKTAGLSEATWRRKNRKYQLWTGVAPPSHLAFPWSTSESEFQNGIWLPSVCSTFPADLWRGGGRYADSTLMGRPTKAALRLCSLDPALTGLAGHRDNELQTRESAALSPWNLVVGSGGEGSSPVWPSLAVGGLGMSRTTGSEFLQLSPHKPMQDLPCCHVWRSHPKRTLSHLLECEKENAALHDLIIYYLEKIANDRFWTCTAIKDFCLDWIQRDVYCWVCAARNALQAGIKNLVITHAAGGLVYVSWVACWEIN